MFTMKLYVTTVNNSFQLLPIFCHKDVDCGFATSSCVVYLVKTQQFDFIKDNVIWKLAYKAKYISEINGDLLMFLEIRE